MKLAAVVSVLSAVLFVSVLSPEARAGQGGFARKHPRRAEINRRERNQQKRIGEGVENGKLTAGQAAHLERQEAGIKRQEEREVKANGGHLTKGEQRQLNRELDHESREINRDEKANQNH